MGNFFAAYSPKWYSFLRVGRLLIGFFILSLSLCYYELENMIFYFSMDHLGSLILHYFLFWFSFSLVLLSVCDARSRFQDYKKAKDLIFFFGVDARLLKPFMNSKCQREAIIVAADELGKKKKAKKLIAKQGYRWYHIVPKFIKTRPQIIFSIKFWKYTFFAPKYYPQAVYKSKKVSQ